MTRVAAAVVTHDAERWLPDTLASIRAQSRPVDRIVVVDDGSTDGTRTLLDEAGVPWLPATTERRDVVSRIAANFRQAVLACGDVDVVVLGDHDDIWLPDRVAHQVERLGETGLMVASDGTLLQDAPGAGTLRDVFPVPAAWEQMSPADRMRCVLRYAVATGGASALRPRLFPTLAVPPGWLHDRWWSLVATAREGLVVDRTPVIEYRVQPGQQVGLDTAAQRHGAGTRLLALSAQARRSWGKQADLRSRLRPLAVDPRVAAAITLRDVLRA